MTQCKTIGEIMEEVRRSILNNTNASSKLLPLKPPLGEDIQCKIVDGYMVFSINGREFYDRCIDEFRDIERANRILEDMREKTWVDDSVIRWMLGILRYEYGYRTTYPCGHLGFCHEAPKFAL